jgi:hypothetical protein
MGLLAYPFQGIYRSLHAATHGDTKKQILSARRVHDIHFARTEAGKVDEDQVLAAFDALGTSQKTLSQISLSHSSSRSETPTGSQLR